MTLSQKRNKLEIIKDFLGAILLNRNIGSTRLLYKSNVSPQMFKDYINELIEKDLISKTITTEKQILNGYKCKPGHTIFNLTVRGREYLEDYKAVELFLEKYGLNEEQS